MNESRAARFQRLRRRAEAVSAVAGALLLIGCATTPAGQWLAGWARRGAAGAPAPLRAVTDVALFVGALALALEALAIPTVIYLASKRKLEGRGILSAQLHAAAVGVVAAVIVGVVVHLAARAAGGWWWLVTGVTLSTILAVAVRAISALIARSDAAKPIDDATLAERLASIAERAGVSVAGFFEWRASEHADHTASITGFGRGRRVLVAPEVLRDWSHDEISVVVAHELSHHKHHDLAQTLIIDALLMSTALAAADLALRVAGIPADAVPALPLIALTASAVWLAATPARLGVSRWQERRADQFALALTGETHAFAAAVRRVGEKNLIEERPDRLTRWLFHGHPTIEERLAMGRASAGVRD